MFLNTDNKVVEQVTHKGTSSSKLLFDLVVRYKLLETRFGCRCYVSHVAGTRMIQQGTDSVSRGSLEEVIPTKMMIDYIPYNKTALERFPNLLSWIQSWTGKDLETLNAMDWFYRGHDLDGGRYNEKGFWMNKVRPGTFLLSPPPAAADVALEQMRIARIKRQSSLHVFCLSLFVVY